LSAKAPVPLRDLVVIGASAGGLEPLKELLSDLPPLFPATVCVVVHMPPWRRSALPEILTRAGPLPAHQVVDHRPMEYGRIYLAPADHHLLVDGGIAYAWHGPKEDRFRPSINALFRSAAVMATTRVIGIVLSGALQDGATGLAWVQRYGGVTIIQEPNDAKLASMPMAALETITPDYIMPVQSMAELIVRLVMTRTEEVPPRADGEHRVWRRDG
jgi:two-component system chemotaxis response regulator CheB